MKLEEYDRLCYPASTLASVPLQMNGIKLIFSCPHHIWSNIVYRTELVKYCKCIAFMPSSEHSYQSNCPRVQLPSFYLSNNTIVLYCIWLAKLNQHLLLKLLNLKQSALNYNTQQPLCNHRQYL